MERNPNLVPNVLKRIFGRGPRMPDHMDYIETIDTNNKGLLTNASIPLEIDFGAEKVNVDINGMNNPETPALPRNSHVILRSDKEHGGAFSTIWYDHRKDQVDEEVIDLELEISFSKEIEISTTLKDTSSQLRLAKNVLELALAPEDSLYKDKYLFQPLPGMFLVGELNLRDRVIRLGNDATAAEQLIVKPVPFSLISPEAQLDAFGRVAIAIGSSAIAKAAPQQPLFKAA
jgi:hypothetical protein